MRRFDLKDIWGLEWIIHIPFWLGWIIIMNAGDSNGFGYYNQPRHDLLIPLIISTSYNVLYFYGNALWLAPKYLSTGKGFKYLGILIVFSAVFILAKTGTEKLFINFALPDLRSVPFTSLIRENLYSLPVFALTSYIYWRYLKNKREKEWLTQEKLRQEIALMKAQVNPHFLFNALNNLYSLGMQGDQEMVTKGILKLSDLLRYLIYDSQQERILLEKELHYIGDFMEVNKLMMRKEDLENISFRVVGDPVKHKIPPVLLVTFVENAFKHGTARNGQLDIDVLAEIRNGTLLFRVRNKINRVVSSDKQDEDYKGLGLNNAKRLLDLLYRNKHELSILEEKGYFLVELKIELE